jgi:hypothetical protein
MNIIKISNKEEKRGTGEQKLGRNGGAASATTLADNEDNNDRHQD